MTYGQKLLLVFRNNRYGEYFYVKHNLSGVEVRKVLENTESSKAYYYEDLTDLKISE